MPYEIYYIFHMLGCLIAIASWLNDFLREAASEPVRLQAAIIGAITFSIPGLWDLTREINDANSKLVDKGPNSVINKRYYQKLGDDFRRFALVPSAVAAGIGLIFVPSLPYPWSLIFVTIASIWLFCLAWVIGSIRNRNTRDLAKFIEQENVVSDDLRAILTSLWQLDASKMANQFGVSETRIYSAMLLHANRLVSRSELNPVLGLIRDFASSMSHRSMQFLTSGAEVVPPLLVFRRMIWLAEQERLTLTESDSRPELLHEWSMYEAILRDVDSAILGIQGRVISETQSYGYFHALETHLAAHGADKKYVVYLIKVIGQKMIEQISTSEDQYSVWEHYFPKTWLITNGALAQVNNHTVKQWNNFYLNWAIRRIGEAKEYDLVLDNVTANLFPELEPQLFAEMLMFVATAYSPGHRIAALAANPVTFGPVGRIFFTDGLDQEVDINRKMDEQRRLAEAATLYYFFVLLKIGGQLNCEVIQECREEIVELKKNPGNTSLEHIQRWERFIDGVAVYLKCDQSLAKNTIDV